MPFVAHTSCHIKVVQLPNRVTRHIVILIVKFSGGEENNGGVHNVWHTKIIINIIVQISTNSTDD